MSNFIRSVFIAAAAAVVLVVGLPRAQTEDVFAFIPPGGRELLIQILQSGPTADDVNALLTGRRGAHDWHAYLASRADSVPVLKDFGDQELATLANYLAFAMPLPADRMPADPARADWKKILPMDGRDLALNYCQSCHIITVVITQDRPVEHWLGTMNKPSHVEIELTPQQRKELANYLVVNGGIPIDLVPEELRAGGASY